MQAISSAEVKKFFKATVEHTSDTIVWSALGYRLMQLAAKRMGNEGLHRFGAEAISLLFWRLATLSVSARGVNQKVSSKKCRRLRFLLAAAGRHFPGARDRRKSHKQKSGVRNLINKKAECEIS
jgi:hypothetical protein